MINIFSKIKIGIIPIFVIYSIPIQAFCQAKIIIINNNDNMYSL